MAATAWVIRLCACVRYWLDGGLVFECDINVPGHGGQILRKPATLSFAVPWITVLRLSSIYGAVDLFRPDHAAHFLHGLAMIFPLDSLCLSAVSLPRQRHDVLDFSCCPMSCVLHVRSGQSENIWVEFHLRSSPSAFSEYEWSVDQLITSLLATSCWRDPTRLKQLPTVAILGSQSGFYHLVVPLSVLRIISVASLFSSLSISCWSDLLEILRKPAAMHFRLRSSASLYLEAMMTLLKKTWHRLLYRFSQA